MSLFPGHRKSPLLPPAVISNDDSRISDVEYDPDADTYHATFDPTTVSANTAVIQSVAAVMRVDPLDIEPLYEYIDTDSLDTLIHSASEKSTTHLSTSFRFEDADVTVHADGRVIVEPVDDP